MSNQVQQTRLTREDGDRLASAIGRFYELREQTIKTPTSDAELKGLVEFISGTMLAHCAEFFGCWVSIRDEYEPILNLLARAGQRISGIQQAYQQRALAAQKASSESEEAKPENVSPLIQP